MEFMSNSDDAPNSDIADVDADDFVSIFGTDIECRSHAIIRVSSSQHHCYQDADYLRIEVQGYQESNEHNFILSVEPDQNPNKFPMIENEAMNHESCTSIVTPESSVYSERESSDGSSVSDNEESVYVHFDSSGYQFTENDIVLGSRIATNAPGITSEYRMFKRDVMKKRQTVPKEKLEQVVYQPFIDYLHAKRKCMDASTIDDLNFFQKEKSESSYLRLLGDDRDAAIIKDIQDNNISRNKARKIIGKAKLEKFVSNARAQLDLVPAGVDSETLDLFRSMLDNMETISPQKESTIEKFVQIYKRNYKWFVKQTSTKKRKNDNVFNLERRSDKGIFEKKRKEYGFFSADGMDEPTDLNDVDDDVRSVDTLCDTLSLVGVESLLSDDFGDDICGNRQKMAFLSPSPQRQNVVPLSFSQEKSCYDRQPTLNRILPTIPRFATLSSST